LPELHPEPAALILTTGLIKGSRRPAVLIDFAFGLSLLAALLSWTATVVVAGEALFVATAAGLLFNLAGALVAALNGSAFTGIAVIFEALLGAAGLAETTATCAGVAAGFTETWVACAAGAATTTAFAGTATATGLAEAEVLA
jgi:hypothetical protein